MGARAEYRRVRPPSDGPMMGKKKKRLKREGEGRTRQYIDYNGFEKSLENGKSEGVVGATLSNSQGKKNRARD